MAAVKKAIVEIIKPKSDQREYKYLELSNELKVLLIRDPETEKSSAAMDVSVGAFFDPVDTPGLAHFLEHMLFMGTEKFPKENEYSNFLQMNGGYSNAYTSEINTNYYFETSHTSLESALDIFSEFFKSSLLLASGVQKEVNAVESEYRKNFPVLSRRMYSVLRELANKNHPYSKFSCGSKLTLMGPVQEGQEKQAIDVLMGKLKAFYEKYYSANIMKLVVLGREPLDVLESWVVSLFSGIKNKNVQLGPEIPRNIKIFPSERFNKLHLMKSPTKDINRLVFEFEVPDICKEWKSKPFNYISHLVGHESEGSILAVLKKLGLAVNVMSSGVSSYEKLKPFDTFSIFVDLTKEGLLQHKKVISIVFQYIKLLRESPIEKWVYDEKHKISAIMFENLEKSKASSYTSMLSNRMQEEYPPEMILKGPFALEEYNPGLISSLIRDYLTVSNCVFLLITSTFEELKLDGVKFVKETYYESEYGEVPLDSSFLKELESAPVTSAVHYPPKNPFIPDNVERTNSLRSSQSDVPPLLENLFQNERVELWYKKEQNFGYPKSVFYAHIRSPIAYASPWHSVMAKLFCELVKDDFNEMAYLAEMAGLGYSFDANIEGFVLMVNGFSDKLLVFLQMLFDKIFYLFGKHQDPFADVSNKHHLEQLEKRLNIRIEELERNYKNFGKESSLQQCMYYTSYCLQSTLWTHGDKLKFLDKNTITLRSLFIFSKDLLYTAVFNTYLHSSLERKSAQDVFEMLNNLLFKATQHGYYLGRVRQHFLPHGASYAFIKKSPDALNPNNSVEYFLQTGQATNAEDRVKTKILEQLLAEAAFNKLRTIEQLGYVVNVSTRSTGSQLGLRFIVMSATHDSVYVESRIEEFLKEYFIYFKEKMDEAELSMHVKSVTESISKKDESYIEEASRWWGKILNGYYEFKSRDRELNKISKLSKDDYVNFYQKLIHPDSPHRAKLSVHVRNPSLPDAKVDGSKANYPQNSSILEIIKNELFTKHGLLLEDKELLDLMTSAEMVDLQITEDGLVEPVSNDPTEKPASNDPTEKVDVSATVEKIAEKFISMNDAVDANRASHTVPTLSDQKQNPVQQVLPNLPHETVPFPPGTKILHEKNIMLTKESWTLGVAPSPIDVPGTNLKHKAYL
ncbi:hypothetical protein MP638_000751 [Amoeboaphelidium occidentale]|nr:hypothetical protein MP638_000751 [Amoeboaphelidium occidentale]